MVCTKADKECPFVQGASPVAIPYIDSDGTPEEAATYLAKSEEIGREMLYLFSLVASEMMDSNDHSDEPTSWYGVFNRE